VYGGKSISPAKEICCSGLLIAHVCSASWLVPELRWPISCSFCVAFISFLIKEIQREPCWFQIANAANAGCGESLERRTGVMYPLASMGSSIEIIQGPTS
jgi:Na+/melibiose symporter-like transporter